LGESNRDAKKPGQNAGVDGVTDHGIGTGGDQFVALLNGDGSSQQPEWQKPTGQSWR
jgi:hypothetical protein